MARARRELPPTTEKALQDRIWKRVLEIRPNAFLFHPVGGPYQTPGIPDLLICMDGLFIGMEIKHPKPGESIEHARARATPQQRKKIRAIIAAGGMAGVVTSEAEALDLLRRAIVKHEMQYHQREGKGHG